MTWFPEPAQLVEPQREIEVEGRRLALSNLDRVLWPETGSTKADMLGYYDAVAPAIVEHVRGHPLTLGRFPDGVAARGWYQTNCRGSPRWLAVHEVVGRRGAVFRMCVVNDRPSLLWVANQGVMELHPLPASAERPADAPAVVFDLDPGPPAGIVECCRVALALRGVLSATGLESFAKTSGSAGIHVYVPLHAGHAFTETKAFARRVAAEMVVTDTAHVVDHARRSLRPGKVLIDWLQNDPTRSTVAPYSLRAAPWPAVSTPVTWEEIERTAGAGEPHALAFRPTEVLRRLEVHGDLFRPVLEITQRLPTAR